MSLRPRQFPRVGRDDVHVAARLFEPARLTLARELRRLTKADLAKKIDKSPSALSQFEAGSTRPDAGTVGALALALELPLGFFTRDVSGPTMSVDQCHFRSLRSASQRDRRSLLARGTLLCELADELEEVVEVPPTRLPTLDRQVTGVDEIERVAEEVRGQWGLGLGPISNVVWLLESNGVIVSYIPSNCAKVDAFSGWRQAGGRTRPFVFLTAYKDATARSRFDAAHEAGHLVMHADAEPGNPDLEREANQFASALLMPRESFGREAPRRLNWGLIWELKRRWGVSARAILYRARHLGLLSEASYRRGFVHLNKTCGRSEPHEPERELPVTLRAGVEVIEEDGEFDELAVRLGLRPRQLRELLSPHVSP